MSTGICHNIMNGSANIIDIFVGYATNVNTTTVQKIDVMLLGQKPHLINWKGCKTKWLTDFVGLHLRNS